MQNLIKKKRLLKVLFCFAKTLSFKRISKYLAFEKYQVTNYLFKRFCFSNVLIPNKNNSFNFNTIFR